MKTKQYFHKRYFIFLVFLLLFNSCTIDESNNSETYYKQLLDIISDIRSAQYELEYSKLKPDIVIKNLDGDPISLEEIFTKTKLVFYFTDTYCPDCIQKELDLLRQNKDSLNISDVVLLSRFNKLTSLKAFKTTNKIYNDIYFVNKSPFNTEHEVDNPVLFVAEPNLIVRMVYIPKIEINYSKNYYSIIKQYLKQN